MDNLSETIGSLRRVILDGFRIEPRKIVRDSYTWKEYLQREGDISEACYRSKLKWEDSELKRLRRLNMTLLDVPLLDIKRFESYKPMFDYTLESQSMDARVSFVTPDVDVLYHLTSLKPRIGGKYFGRLDDLMRKNGVVGNPDEEGFTFLKDKQTDILYGAFYPDDGWPNSNDNSPIRFEINVTELIKSRRIFHDSMGLTTEESDHNYVVFGGVPLRSIRAIEVLNPYSGEIIHRINI
ncbi:MAG TPA: hypothetical protein VJI98_03795 [Candidatus Nanoarchaeia archaeon]|nr:hypothetical protein [Candidatus Nanoarchaeia archaeon]